MLTPWEDEPDDARPKRKPYARPARSYRVGALTYPDREECGPTEIVPYLKLRGRWLDKLGFDVGARLEVEATHGIITLTVVERPVPVVKKIPQTAAPRRLSARAQRRVSVAHRVLSVPARVRA